MAFRCVRQLGEALIGKPLALKSQKLVFIELRFLFERFFLVNDVFDLMKEPRGDCVS